MSLLLTESTTLMLGYSYGDINVRSAAQWVKTFRKSSLQNRLKLDHHQGVIVQLVYAPGTKKTDPTRGPEGELILEVDNLQGFLEELRAACKKERRALREAKEETRKWLADPNQTGNMRIDAQTLLDFAALVKKSRRHLPPGELVKFLEGSLDPVWEWARGDMQFSYYNKYLSLILDLFTSIPINEMHPTLFAYLASCLDRVGGYLDLTSSGPPWKRATGHRATETWRAQRPLLPKELERQLKSYARLQDAAYLEAMLA